MWERSARQNPFSARYQLNRDTRPYLPQDPTTDWLSGRYSDFALIYYIFNSNKSNRILLSNNIPAEDRVQLQKMVEQHSHFMNKMKWLALIPSCVLTGFLYKQVSLKYKIMYPLFFAFAWKLSIAYLNTKFDDLFTDNVSYYYYKYMHLTKTDVSEIEDPRRKFFRLDTSVYYRQTADEIMHPAGHGHQGGEHGGNGGHDHDTSTYYGPYPYNDFENLDHIMEVQKKFTTGHSIYDNIANESLLGEPIDLNRVVPGLPTFQDYKNIANAL